MVPYHPLATLTPSMVPQHPLASPDLTLNSHSTRPSTVVVKSYYYLQRASPWPHKRLKCSIHLSLWQAFVYKIHKTPPYPATSSTPLPDTLEVDIRSTHPRRSSIKPYQPRQPPSYHSLHPQTQQLYSSVVPTLIFKSSCIHRYYNHQMSSYIPLHPPYFKT